MYFFIATTKIIGEVLIAYTVLKVHHRLLKEHKVDEKVFSVMRHEQKVGIFGVILIVFAYIVQMIERYLI